MPFNQTINPVLISIGLIEIRFYGIVYILGLLGLLWWLEKNKKELGIDPAEATLYLFIGMIIGARLGHCFIYNASFYISNPLQILAIWNGGMSFFGGLIGAFIAGYLYARKKNIDLWILADRVVVIVPFFLFLGRIANFLNSELYGKITSVSWCVYFPGVYGCRHPVQIYEALKNLLIFIILVSLRNKSWFKNHRSSLFSLFLILYGSLRFIFSFLRDEPIILLGLTLNHYLSLSLLLVGIALLIWSGMNGDIRKTRKRSKR